MRMRVQHLRVMLSGATLVVAATPAAAQSNRVASSNAVTMAPTVLQSNTAVTIPSNGPATPQPVALRLVGERTVAAATSLPTPVPAPAPRANNGSDVALMGVGAAAVVVGLLVGGDGGAAVAIGGGAIGLVGLYRYLR